eukprot:9126911-Pyramimonas_sp.AAC.1
MLALLAEQGCKRTPLLRDGLDHSITSLGGLRVDNVAFYSLNSEASSCASCIVLVDTRRNGAPKHTLREGVVAAQRYGVYDDAANMAAIAGVPVERCQLGLLEDARFVMVWDARRLTKRTTAGGTLARCT